MNIIFTLVIQILMFCSLYLIFASNIMFTIGCVFIFISEILNGNHLPSKKNDYIRFIPLGIINTITNPYLKYKSSEDSKSRVWRHFYVFEMNKE